MTTPSGWLDERFVATIGEIDSLIEGMQLERARKLLDVLLEQAEQQPENADWHRHAGMGLRDLWVSSLLLEQDRFDGRLSRLAPCLESAPSSYEALVVRSGIGIARSSLLLASGHAIDANRVAESIASELTQALAEGGLGGSADLRLWLGQALLLQAEAALELEKHDIANETLNVLAVVLGVDSTVSTLDGAADGPDAPDKVDAPDGPVGSSAALGGGLNLLKLPDRMAVELAARWRLARSLVEQEDGAFERAQDLIEEAQSLVESLPVSGLAGILVRLHRVQLALRQGGAKSARKQLRAIRLDLGRLGALRRWDVKVLLSLAEMEADQLRPQHALGHVEAALVLMPEQDELYRYRRARGLLIRAGALNLCGRHTEASSDADSARALFMAVSARGTGYEQALCELEIVGADIESSRNEENLAELIRLEGVFADAEKWFDVAITRRQRAELLIRIALETVRPEPWLREAIGLVLPVIHELHAMQLEFDTRRERAAWRRHVTEPMFGIALDIADRLGDSALVSELIAVSRSTGVPGLKSNPIVSAPGVDPEEGYLRRVPVNLRMPDGRIALDRVFESNLSALPGLAAPASPQITVAYG